MELDFILGPILIYLFVVGTIVFFVVLMENRNTSETYAWILVLLILPILGMLIFFLFGRNWRKKSKKRQRRKKVLYDQTSVSLKCVYEEEKSNIATLRKDLTSYGYEKIPSIGYAAPYMMVTSCEDIRIYSHGKEKFSDLLEDIKSAQKFVHMEYYIFVSDKLVGAIFDALVERAMHGVEVRIFYDWFGSVKLSQKDKNRLSDAGVQIHSGRSPLDKINYRSHRKMVIIDAKITYIGGMNMAEHYVTGGKFDEWRDTHLRIVGNFAASAQELFATYWFYATKEKLRDQKYLPIASARECSGIAARKNGEGENQGMMVQLIHSGADTEWETINQVYQEMIAAAKETIILETPYFLPGEGIYSSLINAALGDVKVKIILAGQSDNVMSKNASFTYFKELLIAGVEIYRFETGFLHGKALSIDGKIATVGSANLDPRSMSINYEANVIVYDEAFTRDLEKIFAVDMTKSHKVSLEEMNSVGFFTRLKWSLFRLLSPIL